VNEIAAPELGRVEAERPRRAVEEAVEDERGLGTAGPAVRAHEGLVRDDVDALPREMRHAIRAREVVDGVEPDHVAERRIRSVVAREARLDGGERAVAADAEARAVPLIAVGGGGEEVLAPRLDPLHGPAEPARDGRDQHLLGVRVALDAEAAADVGRQHAYARLAEPERGGDGAAHGVGDLRRGPHREETVRRRGMREHAARLDRHAGHAREVEGRLHHDVGVGEAARDVARAARRDARHVVGPVLEHARRAGSEGALDGRRGRPRLPRHAHGFGAVGRAVGVVGDDHGHRLAGVPRHGVRDGRVAVGAHRGRGHQRRHARRALGQLARGEDGDDAGDPQRPARVDGADARVGVRAAHDGRVQEALDAKVVHVTAAAGEQTGVLEATSASADGRGHGRVAV